MKSIGLLGGSFYPPHRGHIYICLEAKKIFSLNEIWWIITPQNPLKISKPAKYEERFKNCKKITKGMPIFVKEIEKKINSKFTYQTLKYILNHYSEVKFYWLMGADNLIHFHKWQKWNKIFKEISILIFKRHGYNGKALKSIASKRFANNKIKSSNFYQEDFLTLPSWSLVNNKEIKISSTEIKKQRKLLRG